jgi:hypothetical protein
MSENNAPLRMIVVSGTGRIIRKDGTITEFTLEGMTDGTDTRDGDAQCDSGRRGHGDRDDCDPGISD